METKLPQKNCLGFCILGIEKKLSYLCVFPLPSTFRILTYNSSFGGIKNSVTQPWEFRYYYNGSRKFSDTYKDILILCSEYWDTRYTTNKQKIPVVCWMGLLLFGKRLPLKDNREKIFVKSCGHQFRSPKKKRRRKKK